MTKKDPLEYKRKYERFRHHAWAGLGFLSVLLAIRILFPQILSDTIVLPLGTLLVIYVLVALVFTYKYRAGLAAQEEVVHVEPSVELEKERLKVEKKKAKAEAKAKKKGLKEK